MPLPHLVNNITLSQDSDNSGMKRMNVNWTLPNAKRSFATVGGSQRYIHDVTGIQDIDGASAESTRKYVHAKKFADKPHFFAPDDVPGTHPRAQVPPRPLGFAADGSDRALRNRDIEHCYPESKLFATPRIVNPLNPIYDLPPCKHRLPLPEAPKRDPLLIDDIEGARAKRQRTISVNRNQLDTTDIPLSTAGSLSAARKRKTVSRMMETKDITHPPELDVEPFLKNPRGTDPLNPVYKVSAPKSMMAEILSGSGCGGRNYNGNNGRDAGRSAVGNSTLMTIGPVEGSKPKIRPDERKDRPLMSLRCDDIVGSKPKHLGVIKRYQYDERNGGTVRV